MKKEIKLPYVIVSRREYKRKFSFWELYRSLVYTPRAMSKLIGNNKSNLVDKKFLERLQLAVTEVNGCLVCSYQHAKMALRQGMSNEEISSFLSGGDEFIELDEARAIMFAQHYADSKGFPEKYAYGSIVKEYGEEQARIILSAVQIIFAGNMYGIPYSAFQSRLRGHTYKDSSLLYELGMLFGGLVFSPIAIAHGILRGMIGLSNKRLDEKSTDE